MLKSISLAAALAALMTPVVMAWYPCYPAPLTLARLIGEPQCAANETAFHSFSQISIPVRGEVALRGVLLTPRRRTKFHPPSGILWATIIT